MPRTITSSDGDQWEVLLTGRTTQYGSDEVLLTFSRLHPELSETRHARFSPRGAKSSERAYEQASDRLLLKLLDISQPSWTAPEGRYTSGG